MKRLYAVKSPAGTRLIEAMTPAQAIRHAVGTDYSAEVASQQDCVDLTRLGVRVETAGKVIDAEFAEVGEKPAAPVSNQDTR